MPSLRVDEIVRVVRSLDVFALNDIPDVVDALTSHCGKTVPIKKLLLWIEMAKQVRVKGGVLLSLGSMDGQASGLWPGHCSGMQAFLRMK